MLIRGQKYSFFYETINLLKIFYIFVKSFFIFNISMSCNFNLKKAIPFSLAVLIYALFVGVYFAPQFSGEVLSQGDVRQYEGMTQEILETRERTGEDPQWSGSMFSGMPAYLINVEYPSQIIKRWFGGVTRLVSTPAAFIFFAMLSMWLMLVMMGVGGYVAIVGGAMYGLSTYFFLIIGAGHITKMWALVYAPLMMGAITMTLRGNMLWGAALTALFTSLEIGANHPQITYYFLLAALFFWVSELYIAYRESRLANFARRSVLLAVAGLLGLFSNFSPLWYTMEHTPETMRGGSELVEQSAVQSGLDLDYATAWSYGIAETTNLLIPDFAGRDSAHSFAADGEVASVLNPYGLGDLAQQLPTYWGGQPFTAGPTYLGAVVLFLACIGFGLMRWREKWWILAISIFMLLLAWGNNFMWFTELMFNILPGYNKFRTVSMTLVVVEWTVPLLATYGLWRLVNEQSRDRLMRVVIYSVCATVGLALIVMIGGGVIFDFGYGDSFKLLLNAQFPQDLASDVAMAMVSERVSMVWSDGLRSVIYILLTAVAVVAFVRKFIGWKILLGCVGLLVVADLGGVANRFLSHDNFVSPTFSRHTMSSADREILSDKGEIGYRVFNLAESPFNDASTSYYHRSIGGYHGAKLSRYQDIIDNYLANGDEAVLDMLNTRYLILPTEDRRSEEAVLRETPFGAAWFVENSTLATSPQEQINRLGEVDLRRTAIVEQQFDEPLAFSDGEISLVKYEPHHLIYKYNLENDGVAIFSEIYYPKGWRAYVDGEEMPYFRANYILRAMSLPAGEHTVEWRFKAPRWGFIEGVTLVSSIIILLSILVLIIFNGRFCAKLNMCSRESES